tara:strand:- start:3041 stop:5086 length:2046 start_codon:yes stop_codon:yes gene_type:complete
MKLLEPYFLYAFLALAIPILIHLFSLQKHKTVYFSNVAFLRQLQQKKSHITKLQKLLLLLVRLLLLSAIILAFCEPYFSKKDTLTKSKQIIGVYIDNSFSMSANNNKGALIEQAKNNARFVLNAHKGKDEFIFLSNDLQGKHQRIIDYNDCLDAIDNIQISPSVLTLNTVFDRFKSLKLNEINSKSSLYIISDFQKTSTPESFYSHSASINTHLLPINSYPQTNLSIDTCYLENPNHAIGQQEWLEFEVSNTSNELIENLSVKLFINGKQKALSTLNIEANAKSKAKISFNNHSSGTQQAYLELSDATITFDNRLYFNFDVQEFTKVLSIYEKTSNPSLTALFKDPIFEFKNSPIGKLNLADLAEQNLIILEDVENPSTGLINALKNYSNKGGNILIYPSTNLAINSFKNLATALNIPAFTKLNNKKVKVSSINKNHLVFKDVFEKQSLKSEYPEVNSYYSLAKTHTISEENILQLNTKEPLLNSYKNGLGTVYLQCSPLNEESNSLEKHALFVPLLYNIANQFSKNEHLYYTLGKDRLIRLKDEKSSNQWRIKKGTTINLIPEVRTIDQSIQINIQNTLQEDGFYSLTNGVVEKTVSYNFDREESNLTTWGIDELEEISEQYAHINVWYKDGLQLENALKENRSGIPLWRIFILLALFLIFIESLLLKNWKKKAQINLEN